MNVYIKRFILLVITPICIPLCLIAQFLVGSVGVFGMIITLPISVMCYQDFHIQDNIHEWTSEHMDIPLDYYLEWCYE